MESMFQNCSELRVANINFYMGKVKYTNSYSQATCANVFNGCNNLEEIWLSNTNKLYHADTKMYPKGNKTGNWYNVLNGSAYKITSMSGGGHFVADLNMIKPVLGALKGKIPETTRVLNFTNSSLPSGKNAIDVSAKGDGSIIAWLNDDNRTLNISTQNNTGVGIESNDVFRGLSYIEEIYSNGYVGTDKCRDMSNMFSDCTDLNSLDLTGWNLTNVTNVSDMFSNTKISWLRTSLSQSDKLNLGNSGLYPEGDVNGEWISNKNNNSYAVGNLPNAEDIYQTENGFAVLGPLQGKVPSGSTFLIFQNLTTPFVPNPNYEYIDVSKNQDGSILGYYGPSGYYSYNAFRIFAVKPNTKVRVIQKEGDIGVFRNTPMKYIACTKDTLDFSRTTHASYMFAGCSNLYQFVACTIKDRSTLLYNDAFQYFGNLEKADHMFADCTGLDLGNVNFYSSKLKDVSYMFANCTSMRTPSEGSNFMSASQYIENMEGYLYNCTSITSGTAMIPKMVKNMSYFYYGCKSLTSGDNLSSSSASYAYLEDMSYMYANSSAVPLNFGTHDINYDTVNLTGIFSGAKIQRISLPAGHPFNDKKYGLVPNGNSNGYWYIPKSSTSYRAYALPTSTAGTYTYEMNSTW